MCGKLSDRPLPAVSGITIDRAPTTPSPIHLLMSEFVHITTVADVPDGSKQYYEIEDRLIVLFHVDGQFHCLDDVCTHDGGPLGEGQLTGHQIACPRHGAKFDIRTGKAVTMPATEGTVVHEVKVEGDRVLVRINDR